MPSHLINKDRPNDLRMYYLFYMANNRVLGRCTSHYSTLTPVQVPGASCKMPETAISGLAPATDSVCCLAARFADQQTSPSPSPTPIFSLGPSSHSSLAELVGLYRSVLVEADDPDKFLFPHSLFGRLTFNLEQVGGVLARPVALIASG